MKLKTYGNGDVVTHSYDSQSRVLSLAFTNDLAGQLTNEISGGVTNTWAYDEAGNWLNASASTKWVYDPDNEIPV